MPETTPDHARGRPLLVRTVGSPAIGMGHAMRCLSLAEAYVETGGSAAFLMADPPAGFARRVGDRGAQLWAMGADPGSSEDIEQTLTAAGRIDAGWIVLDGYQFDGGFQAGLVAGGRHRVLAFDDHGHAGRYSADIVLNQNAGASDGLYRDRRPETRLLLGPGYALLRDEFRRWPAPRPEVPAVARRIVVTFGGSDPDNVSAKALEGLASVPEPLEVMVVVGPTNPNLAALRSAAGGAGHPVEVVIDPPDMAARLAWADIAVAASGGTSWELARVGTPHIAIVLADNQEPGARALARDGLAISLGWHADVSPDAIGGAVAALARDSERRAELSRRGRDLVDGRGAERVLDAMGLVAPPAL